MSASTTPDGPAPRRKTARDIDAWLTPPTKAEQLAEYRATIAELSPDQRFGRRLAFWFMAVVLSQVLLVGGALMINLLSGDPAVSAAYQECLAEGVLSSSRCWTEASRGGGPIALPGWPLFPGALAAAALLVLVWPPRRHYFAVRPTPTVIVAASPLWFGGVSLAVTLFVFFLSFRFSRDTVEWLIAFGPPSLIWAAVALAGLIGGGAMRSRERRMGAGR